MTGFIDRLRSLTASGKEIYFDKSEFDITPTRDGWIGFFWNVEPDLIMEINYDEARMMVEKLSAILAEKG